MKKLNIIELTKLIEQENSKIVAFKKYACKHNVNYLSVRNFYYKNIHELKVDSQKNKVIKYDYFNKQDEKLLIDKINDNLKKGISVRKTCLELAHNDPKMMVRLQNKYRNVVYKTYYKYNKGTTSHRIEQTEVLKFNNSKTISDVDVNNLFLGLIRLVKNKAVSETKEIYDYETQQLKLKIQQLKNDVSTKQKLIEKLKAKVENINITNSIELDNVN